jgi:hypothetical protein
MPAYRIGLAVGARMGYSHPGSSLLDGLGMIPTQFEAMMVRARLLHLVMAVTVAPLCGCGTMANLQGKRLPAISRTDVEETRPFGGVARDARWISSLGGLSSLIFVADLPWSLVGDILTLPRTLRKHTHAGQPASEPERGRPVGDSPE